MLKNTLLSCAILLSISGCNSSDDSTDAVNNTRQGESALQCFNANLYMDSQQKTTYKNVDTSGKAYIYSSNLTIETTDVDGVEAISISSTSEESKSVSLFESKLKDGYVNLITSTEIETSLTEAPVTVSGFSPSLQLFNFNLNSGEEVNQDGDMNHYEVNTSDMTSLVSLDETKSVKFSSNMKFIGVETITSKIGDIATCKFTHTLSSKNLNSDGKTASMTTNSWFSVDHGVEVKSETIVNGKLIAKEYLESHLLNGVEQFN